MVVVPANLKTTCLRANITLARSCVSKSLDISNHRFKDGIPVSRTEKFL